MAERKEILEMWRRNPDASAVLATLIRIEGSSYRRPGARMYIQRSGYAGSISGGCLEGEVARKAGWLARNGAAIERYSTLYDEGAPPESRDIPYGLGCGGVLDLLLEPTALPETQAMLSALADAEQGAAFGSATLLPLDSSSKPHLVRAILRRDSAVGTTPFFISNNLDASTHSLLVQLAAGARQAGTVSVTLNREDRSVYVEQILPPQRLVVFGAGHDASPLVHMAHLLGWRTAVADGRAWLAQPARFPQSEQVLVLDHDAGNLTDLRLTPNDAVAILTHSFDQDRSLLPRLLPLGLRYVGLLGARNRSQLLLKEVAAELAWSPEECLRRVHAPIGLNLGGDSPQAVALTIIAEIQSVLHGKSIGARGMSEQDLHVAPQQPYVPTQCPLDYPPEDLYPEPLQPSHAQHSAH